MKFLIAAMVLVSMAFAVGAKEGPKPGKFAYHLKKFEGKKSLLLIFAVEPKDPRFKKTQEGILGRYADFRKKNLGVFYIFETQTGRADDLKLRPVDAQDLRKSFKVKPGEFKVLLIDKAGKTVKQSTNPMSKAELDAFLGLGT